jgi:hypothetical protein
VLDSFHGTSYKKNARTIEYLQSLAPKRRIISFASNRRQSFRDRPFQRRNCVSVDAELGIVVYDRITNVQSTRVSL